MRAEEGGRRRRMVRRARVVGTVMLVVLVLAAGTWLVDPEIDGTSARDRVRSLVEDEPEGTYAFLLIAREGGAVGWDPCEPVKYVVNPEGAPADWESFTDAAVSAIAEASGFDFTYAGTTEARPLDETGIRGAPLLISWADPQEVPALAEESFGVALNRTLVKKNRSYIVSGVVVLDEQTYAGLASEGDARASELIVTHELGHILGLDDVDDPAELMNEEYVGQDGFGTGRPGGSARGARRPVRGRAVTWPWLSS